MSPSATAEAVVHYRIPYRPGPSQLRFHGSPARFKAFSGPVGSGKTLALCQEALKLAFLNPGLPGVIGAPTYRLLRDVTRRTFLEILERAAIPHELHRSDNVVVLLDTRSEIMFRSLKEPDALRGPNLAWYAADELTYAPWGSWQELQKRLRHPQATELHGCAAFTPKGFDRAYDFFCGEQDPGRELLQANPFENAPNLAPGYYDELKRSLDALFYQQEVLGRYLNVFASQPYWAFDRRHNVREYALDPAQPLWWSLDFNVDPLCSVVGQTFPARPPLYHGGQARPLEVRVLDEIALRSSSTYDAAQEFLGRYAGHAAGLKIYGDPAGKARHTAASKSDWQLLREVLQTDPRGRDMRAEFRVLSVAPLVKDRVQAVNALLCSASGERRLFVAPHCRELIADFEKVSWKRGSAGLVMDKQEDPQRTHTSDALGYYVWYEHPLRGTIGEKGQAVI